MTHTYEYLGDFGHVGAKYCNVAYFSDLSRSDDLGVERSLQSFIAIIAAALETRLAQSVDGPRPREAGPCGATFFSTFFFSDVTTVDQ